LTQAELDCYENSQHPESQQLFKVIFIEFEQK